MGLEHPGPGRLSAVRMVEHTWHSALITWLSGRASIAQVEIDIATVPGCGYGPAAPVRR